jgi:hypothetical protein
MLRIYIDTNDMSRDGWCYLLRYQGKHLDAVASELGVSEGMEVVLYYSDPGEEFEYNGRLHYVDGRWLGRADMGSYRLIRVTPIKELRKEPRFRE